jgi:hypothetical protein
MEIKMKFLAMILMLIPAVAIGEGEPTALEASIQQLREAVGNWSVTTEFLNEDGTVSRSTEGSYRFEWVVEDRVVSGVSDIPEMDMRAAILFYVNEGKGIVEMVSVAKDGRLGIMTGPLGEETRYTQKFPTQSGGEGQLRFTRYNVGEDTFESRMEYTEDDGATWKPGNHQLFRRQP